MNVICKQEREPEDFSGKERSRHSRGGENMAQNQTMELKQELVKQAERPQNEAKLTKNMSIPDIVKALSRS